MSTEFTGDYYLCHKCNHVWDYMDDACPNCGSHTTEQINAMEVNEFSTKIIKEHKRLNLMLLSHGDFNVLKAESNSKA